MNIKKTAALILAVSVFLSFAVSAFALEASESYSNGIYARQLSETELTGNKRRDIVEVAYSQLGYRESNSQEELSGEVKGSRNCTEYGRAFGDTQVPWCAVFIWWCARQAGIDEEIIPCTASASESAFECEYRALKECPEPRAGDIAFIDSNGDGKANHVGIIAGVEDGFIITIEGNCSNAVTSRKYSLDSGIGGAMNIISIGFPEYEGRLSENGLVHIFEQLTNSKKAQRELPDSPEADHGQAAPGIAPLWLIAGCILLLLMLTGLAVGSAERKAEKKAQRAKKNEPSLPSVPNQNGGN